MEHLRVNIGCHSSDCFHYFDNEYRMFHWISEHIGHPVNSYADCENWTVQQKDERLYIEILSFDVTDFYAKRKQYINLIDRCNTYLRKAQQATSFDKRSRFLDIFSDNYEAANQLAENHPFVWQGEI